MRICSVQPTLRAQQADQGRAPMNSPQNDAIHLVKESCLSSTTSPTPKFASSLPHRRNSTSAPVIKQAGILPVRRNALLESRALLILALYVKRAHSVAIRDRALDAMLHPEDAVQRYDLCWDKRGAIAARSPWVSLGVPKPSLSATSKWSPASNRGSWFGSPDARACAATGLQNLCLFLIQVRSESAVGLHS